MESFKLPLALLVLLGFVCACNGNAISGLFGKSSDDKAGADAATAVDTGAPSAKSAAETTTTTTTAPVTGTSCGGLKGFLHICQKNEPTDPPKTVKTRSVSNDESDSDSDDSDDSSDSEESSARKLPVNTTEKAVAKRQAEDPEAPVAPEEEPPTVDSTPSQPQNSPEEAVATEKRQADDSSSSEESGESSRRRRDCRDRYGDYDNNCRRKRESQL